MARHGLRCPMAADSHGLHCHGTYDRLPIAHFISDVNVATIIHRSQLLSPQQQTINWYPTSSVTYFRCGSVSYHDTESQYLTFS